VSCARCHDHKFDPVSTAEYYGLYGVFANSTDAVQPLIGEPGSGPDYEDYERRLAEKRKPVEEFLEPKLAELAKRHPELAGKTEALKARLDRADRRKLQNLQRVVDKFVADEMMEPDRALVLRDRATPVDQRVFIRGNPGRRGEVAPRRFLALGSDSPPEPFSEGSGRLEMAREIASPTNPLTARVIVNRVWMWHFGEGIVRTVSDFGLQGELPDHPELLDWMAKWFVENGWSLKELHRLILTSETWRQSSRNPRYADYHPLDPENRELWRFPRRRVDFEQMRDGVLATTEGLDATLFGPSVRILEAPYSNRRSVYAFIDRQNLNPVFRTFDFSNPQESTGKRPETTVPMQALFTLNSEFVQNHAASLAKRIAGKEDPVGALHRALFARDPSLSDRHMAESFLASFRSESAALGKRQTHHEWSYGYGGVDAETGEVAFTPLPVWTGDRWQASREYPVKNSPLSYLHLRKGSGHPGSDERHSLIYEWRAPGDMTIDIAGALQRPNEGKGDGVRGRIVTSRDGVVKDSLLPAEQTSVAMEAKGLTVREGDKVWFVIEPRETASFDSTQWSPEIAGTGSLSGFWSLAEQFSGPARPAGAWDAYAHALLNTNRFLFID